MKTAFGYDGLAQSCGEEVCKTLVAGKGYGDRCDSIPKVLVMAFNFELFASPPPETVDALCACRAGDWMLVQRSQGFRAGSFGQFVSTDAAGTLDCGHMAGVGNGTPCLVLCYDGYNQSTSSETSIRSARRWAARSGTTLTRKSSAPPYVMKTSTETSWRSTPTRRRTSGTMSMTTRRAERSSAVPRRDTIRRSFNSKGGDCRG